MLYLSPSTHSIKNRFLFFLMVMNISVCIFMVFMVCVFVSLVDLGLETLGPLVSRCKDLSNKITGKQ